MTLQCPCGSGNPYEVCCKPLITHERSADTAQELMRARYSAYAMGEVAFIIDSTVAHRRDGLNAKSIEAWSKNSEWLKLDILDSQKGELDDDQGKVEFIAHYREDGVRRKHHEIADFVKKDGAWYFNDASNPTPTQVVRDTPKVGRNAPCPCGSGKKFKKCCGR